MQVARAARARADREFAGDLRLGASREGRRFFVPRVHPADRTVTLQRVRDAVQTIAHQAVDPLDADPFQRSDHEIGNVARRHAMCLSNVLSRRSFGMRRGRAEQRNPVTPIVAGLWRARAGSGRCLVERRPGATPRRPGPLSPRRLERGDLTEDQVSRKRVTPRSQLGLSGCDHDGGIGKVLEPRSGFDLAAPFFVSEGAPRRLVRLPRKRCGLRFPGALDAARSGVCPAKVLQPRPRLLSPRFLRELTSSPPRCFWSPARRRAM